MTSSIEVSSLPADARRRARVAVGAARGARAPRVWELWVERGCDITLAVLALVFTAPLLLMIAVVIKLQDGGDVLFRQTRIGRYGRPFRCYKFRSMVPDAAGRLEALLAADPAARAEWDRDHKLRRDPRITSLGGFLRRSSLDELPQLLNILRGEMSWVGPRPIVQAEVAKYGRWYRHYTRLKPGLTGMWQVSGRNDTTYTRRIALDIAFSRSRSLRLYFYILLMTAPAVLSRKGTY
jgi:exopolysaccharide production protein ExoY